MKVLVGYTREGPGGIPYPGRIIVELDKLPQTEEEIHEFERHLAYKHRMNRDMSIVALSVLG